MTCFFYQKIDCECLQFMFWSKKEENMYMHIYVNTSFYIIKVGLEGQV